MRVVALALSAPLLLAMPATSAVASSGHPSSRAVTASPRTDRVLVAPTSVRTDGRDATVAGSDRLRAPARIHLLAARVYWGAAHPSYPSTRRATHDLDATAAYYDRVSRGHETLHVTLTRWVHVNAGADTMCNRLSAAARITSAALTRAGYHPGRFNRLMIFTEQCNAAVSAAQQPGRLSWIRYRNPGAATLIHELGHNLGLGHANGVVCRADGRRVAFGGTCHSVEYGDSWDAMGHARASFSVPVLERLGWAGRVATAQADGSFRIADVEHAGDDIQAVRIPVGQTTYWVEYQPEHLTEVGRSIAGVTIRRQVGDGRVQIVDAAPGNPTGAALPRRRPDQCRAAGRQQLHHAGGRPDHHGRHRSPGHRPGRLRPGRGRPGRPGRRLRRPAGRGPVPRPLAAARRQRPDRARLPRDRARLGPLGLPALHGRRTDLARAGR